MIRDLRSLDRPLWEKLWLGYQSFYGVALGRDVTEATWQRLMMTDELVWGLGAFEGESMLGLAHFLFHRSTWKTGDTCYLQDLFVVPQSRGRGVATKLIEAVYRAADAQGARQVYWLTHKDNAAARKIYDRCAIHSGFVVYERLNESD